MNNLTPEQVDALNAVVKAAAVTTGRNELFDSCGACGKLSPDPCGDSCRRHILANQLRVVYQLVNNRMNHQKTER